MQQRGNPEELAGAGPALFRVVRFWSRRWALGATGQTAGERGRVQHVMILEAADSAAGGRAEVSVADIAHHLGIDHSGASRFVAAAIDAGYLRKTSSSTDRRRVALAITPEGAQLLTNAHLWQEQTFADLTARWDRTEAAQFAHHLRRLADELTQEPPNPAR